MLRCGAFATHCSAWLASLPQSFESITTFGAMNALSVMTVRHPSRKPSSIPSASQFDPHHGYWPMGNDRFTLLSILVVNCLPPVRLGLYIFIALIGGAMAAPHQPFSKPDPVHKKTDQTGTAAPSKK